MPSRRLRFKRRCLLGQGVCLRIELDVSLSFSVKFSISK